METASQAVSVESSEGKGSTFRFTLPAKPAYEDGQYRYVKNNTENSPENSEISFNNATNQQ
jgi:hypothetical protein